MIGSKFSGSFFAENQNTLVLVLKFVEALLQPIKIQKAYFIRPSLVLAIFRHEKATLFYI